MSVRKIFCEGPDDVAALRAIGQHFFRMTIGREEALPAAGWRRRAVLSAEGTSVQIVAVPNAKSGLARDVALSLATLRGQDDEPSERVTHVAAVFDPDDEQIGAFERELENACASHAEAWTLTRHDDGWSAARADPSDTLELRAVAWLTQAENLPNVSTAQSLDRVLCAIARDAHPQHQPLIDRWTAEAKTALAKPSMSWKAALHLWCALVAPKQNEISSPAEFLQQRAECEPHARRLLEEVGLLTRLRDLFGLAATPASPPGA